MDDIARDYLLLALSIGRFEQGFVDSYYGPAELAEEAEQRRVAPDLLAVEASALRQRVADSESDEQRARWLDRQLLAMETICGRLAGDRLSYDEEVERCFDAAPERTLDSAYDATHAHLDGLLSGSGDLRSRIEQRNELLTMPADRLPAILDWLVDEIRALCLESFPAPAGESLTLSTVTNQPWTAYNWYEGGLRSRIDFNTDLPARAPELISLVTHEAFPGHHLEHCWKESRLVNERGRGEASIQLINTPEAYLSEGLAEVGGRYVVDEPRWQALFAGICEQAGITPGDADPASEWHVSRTLRGLRAVSADAALMLHADSRPRDEVLTFLEQRGLLSQARAEKSLEFIDHPLWRTYVFCYSGGERLLGEWCTAAGELPAQRARFLRLLTEQLTPSAIAAELDSPTGAKR